MPRLTATVSLWLLAALRKPLLSSSQFHSSELEKQRVGELNRVLADHHRIDPPWRRRQVVVVGVEQLLESLVPRGKKPETAELVAELLG